MSGQIILFEAHPSVMMSEKNGNESTESRTQIYYHPTQAKYYYGSIFTCANYYTVSALC